MCVSALVCSYVCVMCVCVCVCVYARERAREGTVNKRTSGTTVSSTSHTNLRAETFGMRAFIRLDHPLSHRNLITHTFQYSTNQLKTVIQNDVTFSIDQSTDCDRSVD